MVEAAGVAVEDDGSARLSRRPQFAHGRAATICGFSRPADVACVAREAGSHEVGQRDRTIEEAPIRAAELLSAKRWVDGRNPDILPRHEHLRQLRTELSAE